MSSYMHQIFYCNLLLFKWQCHIKKRNIYFAVKIHLSRKAIIKCSQTSKLHNFVARSQICWKLLKPRSLKTRVNSYSKNSAIEFQNIFCINSTLDQKWPYQKKGLWVSGTVWLTTSKIIKVKNFEVFKEGLE